MKKVWMTLLFTLSLILALAPSALAAEFDLVVDYADVLTDGQWTDLMERAEAITSKYRCDVIIVTIDEMDDDDGAYEWARYIYEANNYGYGAEKSGVLLFLSTAGRDYALIAYGYGNTAFTDHGKDVMLDRHILPLLKNDRYYDAFSAYLDKADEYLEMARAGNPFDVGTDPGESDLLFKLGVVILVPAFIAWIICSIWKKKMKTAVTAKTACNYIPDGGFKLTGQTDMFLFKTRTQTKIQTSSSSGGTTKDSKGFSGRSGKF